MKRRIDPQHMLDAAQTQSEIRNPQSKIRIGVPSGYPAPFCFDLGQRNAEVSRRKFVRGSRFLPWLDAITLESGGDCDLLHTLNAVPVRTNKPFVVTFESYLPRVPDDRPFPTLERFLMRRLMSSQCRRIIAFSDYALAQFRAQIDRHPGTERLLGKTELIYPAIAAQRSEPKYPRMNRLRLLFVGRQFMHKGGPAVLRAHEQLRAMGIAVETAIVSSLEWNPRGLVGPSSEAIFGSEVARLSQTGITHIRELDNAGVLRLIDNAHFLLLPTVNDTFGFSCLEAMAHGTPVIASRTCALPEIVDDGKNGFLLDMPNGANRRWTGLAQRRTGDYDRLYLELMDNLAEQIATRLSLFWNRQSDYVALSQGALATVEEKFNRDRARERLERIYEEALA